MRRSTHALWAYPQFSTDWHMPETLGGPGPRGHTQPEVPPSPSSVDDLCCTRLLAGCCWPAGALGNTHQPSPVSSGWMGWRYGIVLGFQAVSPPSARYGVRVAHHNPPSVQLHHPPHGPLRSLTPNPNSAPHPILLRPLCSRCCCMELPGRTAHCRPASPANATGHAALAGRAVLPNRKQAVLLPSRPSPHARCAPAGTLLGGRRPMPPPNTTGTAATIQRCSQAPNSRRSQARRGGTLRGRVSSESSARRGFAHSSARLGGRVTSQPTRQLGDVSRPPLAMTPPQGPIPGTCPSIVEEGGSDALRSPTGESPPSTQPQFHPSSARLHLGPPLASPMPSTSSEGSGGGAPAALAKPCPTYRSPFLGSCKLQI